MTPRKARADPRARGRFAWLWTGEALNVVGTSTGSTLVPMVAIFQLGAGPEWLGILTAAAWLPWLVVGVPAGVFIDAHSPRGAMIVANLASALAVVSVPIAAILEVLSLPQLLIVALVLGCGSVFFRSAYPKLVSGIVPTKDLESANARLLSTEAAAQMAGPGIAGLIAQVGGAAIGLFGQFVGLLASAICLTALGHVPRGNQQQVTERWSARVSAGFRRVFRDPILRNLIVSAGISNFGLVGVTTLLILFLTKDLELAPAGVGLLLGLGAAGGVIGAATAPMISRRFGSARSTVALQVAQVVIAVLPFASGPVGVVVVGIASAVLSFTASAGNVIRGAWRQRYIEPGLLARATSVTHLINFSLMPLAGLAAGLLGGAIGLRPTLAVMACVLFVAAVTVAFGPLRAKRELPESAAAEPAV